MLNFNYIALIYYKVGQYLLQTGASITKWDRYYKVWQALLKGDQFCVIIKWGKTYSKLGQTLQCGNIIITKLGHMLQSGPIIKK